MENTDPLPPQTPGSSRAQDSNLRRSCLSTKNEEEPAPYKCSVLGCVWPGGKHRSTLYYHRQKFHPELIGGSIDQDGNECHICSAHLVSVEKLAEHLKTEHEDDIIIENRSFSSFAAFESWKEEIRNAASVDFVIRRQWAKAAKHRSNTFYCSRSGVAEPKGTGKRPPRISVKSNANCCAFLNVKHFEDGTVQVRYCLQHSGHDVNVARLRLVYAEKALIAFYLKEGYSVQNVVQKLRDLNPSPSDRLFYITAQAVENVKKEWDVETHRLHSNDMASVAEFVRLVTSEVGENDRWSDVLLYSAAKDEQGHGFRLGLMTREQLSWLEKYGNKGVCLDGTHHSTRYTFHLITLLVLDDMQKGRPVAFYFCKGENETELTPFFEEIRKRCPSLSPQVFMSDDASAYWNSWTAAFGTSTLTKKMLCSWHVLRNWRKNLNDCEKDTNRRALILNNLRILLRQATEEQFVKSLTHLLSQLSLFGLDDYRVYLETNYLKEEKLLTWAPYNRRKEMVNTNMVLERFHHTLKSTYLNRSENRRLDFVLRALLRCTADMVREVEVMEFVPTCHRQYRLSMTHRNHRRAVEFYGQKRQLLEATPDANVFVVHSETKKGVSYTVKMLSPCNCDEKRRCRFDDCQLCWHEIECECMDSCRAGVCCKHAHAVSTFLLSSKRCTRSTNSDLPLLNEQDAFFVSAPEHDDDQSNYQGDAHTTITTDHRESLSEATKKTSTILHSLIDSVPENRQQQLNAMIKDVVDFAVANTTSVTTRERVNGRPPNAPIQDVYKRSTILAKKRKALKSADDANHPFMVASDAISACAKCFKADIGVDWVSCDEDRCDLWYHQTCVGFVADVDRDTTFICPLHEK